MIESPLRIAIAVFCALVLSAATTRVAAQNQAPSVSIAPLSTLSPTMPLANLVATVVDDGLPSGDVTVFWAKQEGPGPIVFEDPFEAATTAHFDVAGDYVLRVTVSDGELESFATVAVTLLDPPGLPIIVQNILAATGGNGLDPLFVDRFLTLVPNADPANTTGVQYYQLVDPLNQKTNFASWKAANGFPTTDTNLIQVAESDGMIGCCTSAVYLNAADLGFGRRMVMSRNGGDVAFFVTNYFDSNATAAEDPAQLILTVAMEYSALPGDNIENRYVKFYMFDAAGNRITDVDFDGRGPKPVPSSCIVCHGGGFEADGGLASDGRIGAYFLPFDINSFDFPTHPDFRRENQEASFREFNEAILGTEVPPAVQELIEGWYGGFGLPEPEQNSEFVPTGWRSSAVAGGGYDAELYRDVVAPSCRMCHIAQNNPNDFNQFSDFANNGSQINSLVLGPSPADFRMPHSKVAFERFWLSTNPSQPSLLASAFDQNGDFIGVGQPAGRRFVDLNAAGSGDGMTWENAYTSLSQALDDASQPGAAIDEIWVAAGTYVPTTAMADPREATFLIPDGVRLYGGFVPGDALLEERDFDENSTILDGDLSGDDPDFGFGAHAENAYHVVTSDCTCSTTVLDGFFIRGGNATGATDPRGAGLLLTNGALAMANCVFFLNQGTEGAGICIDGGSLVMRLCELTENLSTNDGTGVLMVNGASLDAESVLFNHNVATAGSSRGGAIANIGGNLRLVNGTIFRNYSEVDPGGIFSIDGAQTVIANSILWENCGDLNDQDGQVQNDDSMGAVAFSIDRSIVQGLSDGLAVPLGGSGNIDSNPLFVDELGPDTFVGSRDEDFRLMEASPAIDSGDADFLRNDFQDLDHDGVFSEPTPFDFLGEMRRIDDVLTMDAIADQAPAIDMGAIEYSLVALNDVALGNVGTQGGGLPEPVFRVNGELGGAAHRVDVGVSQPFNMTVDVPSSMAGLGFSNFALFARLGAPTPNQAFASPLDIGDLLFTPIFAQPFESGDNFVLTDNLGLGIPGALPSVLAPWFFNVPAMFIMEPLDITIQGYIIDFDAPSTVIPISVTNGIVISIRENIPGNAAPEVSVTNDLITACLGDEVIIEAIVNDFDGDPLNIQWTQIVEVGDPVVALTGDTTDTLTFTAPGAAATLVFELVVDDGFAFAPTIVVTVEVGGDGPPSANAGQRQVVNREAAVSLDGSASCDPDGGALTFAWTQIGTPTVTLSNATTATPSFMAPDDSVELTFQLIVTDDELLESEASLVTVRVCTTFLDDDIDEFFTTPQDAFSPGGPFTCTNCHPGVNNPAFNQGTPEALYNSLFTNGVVNTTPGLEANSLILTRPLTGPGGMPQFFENTSDSRYQLILDWIMDGAPLDRQDCEDND